MLFICVHIKVSRFYYLVMALTDTRLTEESEAALAVRYGQNTPTIRPTPSQRPLSQNHKGARVDTSGLFKTNLPLQLKITSQILNFHSN